MAHSENGRNGHTDDWTSSIRQSLIFSHSFCFSSFFTPNTSQYWILIEFWPDFGFPDVLRAVFVKFPHFGHIFIHKMSSISLGKHFLALVKKSNLA